MAYALGLPKDVTDRIYSMRDWRWEMVRDGGKTPSAKCFETEEFHDETADRGKVYIEPSRNLPTFTIRLKYRHLPTREMPIDKYNVPNCEEHPDLQYTPVIEDSEDERNYNQGRWRGSIDVWMFRRGDWHLMDFLPSSPRVETRAAKPADLWWQCEPCQQ